VDRTVTVRFYTVGTNTGAPSLRRALQDIAARSLLDREDEVEDGVVVRLERAEFPTNLARGELIRRQISNLPPKALAGKPIENLGVEAIGHSTAFLYDAELSILAFEQARNGITATRFALYIDRFLDRGRYDIFPIPTKEMWDTLQTGRVRGMTVRCATPQSLQAADDVSDSVRHGLIALQHATETHFVEATLRMKRGDPDVQRDRALHWFWWFRREHEYGRGAISNVYVDIIPEGETQTAHLNLLRGQIGGQRRLNLPEDDPEASYKIRANFLAEVFETHRSELEERYRQ
jgi:hypothetical protein